MVVVTATPTKGAASRESDGEFVVPSLPPLLVELSDLVTVVSPAEYNVLVIVTVGEMSEVGPD